MLPSQFEALEEPSDAIIVDISLPPRAIVAGDTGAIAEPRRPLRAMQPSRYPEKAWRG